MSSKKLASYSVIENRFLRRQIAFNLLILITLLILLFTQQDYNMRCFLISAGLVVLIILAIVDLLKNNPTINFIGLVFVLLLYGRSFEIQLMGSMIWWLPALLLAFGVIFFLLLLPKLDNMLLPSLIMWILFIQLLWISGELWLNHNTWANLSGFIGSSLFTLAALITVINHYKKPTKSANLLIGIIYLSSQLLITLSVLLPF